MFLRIVTFICLFAALPLAAQDFELLDQDGDGAISVMAFGDSITFGIGDEEEIGYPARLQRLVNLTVLNRGDPGEQFIEEGINRLVDEVRSSSADYVLLLEGSNDAFSQKSSEEYEAALQKAINVIPLLGKVPLPMTIIRPCCEHAHLVPFTESYSDTVKFVAALNEINYVDLNHAWYNSCGNGSDCSFYNLPEGLHPNAQGYLAIAQTIAAKLLNIDIFLPEGPAALEAALALPAGSVLVKPDVVPVAVP